MKERPIFESEGGLLHTSPQWAIELFGFEENGMGDFGSRTAAEGRKTKDPKYAYLLRELLIDRKRWPNALQIKGGDRIAKTKLRYGWSKTVHWFRMLPVLGKSGAERAARLKDIKPRLCRTQHGMTRDPYTWYYGYVADLGLDPKEWITPVRMPLYLRRRGGETWRKFLETGEDKYLKKFERISLWQLRLPRRVFAMDMARMRAEVVGSTKILELIEKITPIPNKG